MYRAKSIVLCAAAVLAAGLPVESVQAVVLSELTDLGPGSGYGINASGQVSGFNNSGAFLYDGTMHDLDATTSSIGTGINDSGHVTGVFRIAVSNDRHAFVHNGASLYDLGTLGGNESDGRGINASGQVTGYSNTTGYSSQHAFLWNPNTPNGTSGIMYDLGTLGGSSSRGIGINTSGQVVGGSRATGDLDHAFLWKPSAPNGTTGTMYDLGTLGGTNSEAFGINASGQVTGWANTAGGGQKAFLWTPTVPNGTTGTMQDLGTLGGGIGSLGIGINANGQVVGASYTTGGFRRAFMYRSGNGMVDLNTFIDPATGWELETAIGINDAGQITGYGRVGGATHAFLLTLFDIWNNPSGGDWGLGSNWFDGSTAGNSDHAVFNLASTYEVDFGGQPAGIENLTVTNGTVTFRSVTTTRTLSVNSGGSMDAVIEAATLNLGRADNTLPVNLTVGDDLIVNGGGILNIHANSIVTVAANSELRINPGGRINIGSAATTGTVSSANAYIGIGSGSEAVATVTGASSWDNSSSLYVGDSGIGSLTISAGGTVSNTSAYVGRNPGSVGTATVAGAGSTWTSSGDLTIAGSGSSGTLTIEGSGTVNSATLLNHGFLNLAGGTLNTGSLFNDGTFNFASGTLHITGPGGLTMSSTTLGNSFSLGPNRTLNVTNTTTIPTGTSLALLGGTLTTTMITGSGAFSFNSGTLNLTGAGGLTIGAGQLLGSTALLGAAANLNVTNILSVNAGSYLAVAGGLSAGNLVNNGDLVVINTAIDSPLVNNNAVTVVGLVDFNGLVSGPGDFFGPGAANFNGGLAPGASTAEVNFEGSLALADTNTLFIEIGGITPGSQYDRLTIAGNASIDGILDVSLINGFTLSGGQQFTILTASSIVNNGFVLAGPAASSFSLLVNSTSVILQAIGLPGDFNFDGAVDAADYIVWRMNGLSQAEFNAWRANFGAAAGSGSSITGTVPEPAASVMLLTGVITMFVRSRAKRLATSAR